MRPQVELAVRFGKTLLIRDVDGVESGLVPLVRLDLQQAGGRQMVQVRGTESCTGVLRYFVASTRMTCLLPITEPSQIGDKQVDFNERFKLFLATRNPDPRLPPDVSALVTTVNFTVTRSGLEGQLLSATIQHERPELEAKKSELLAEVGRIVYQ